jgi:hypothetical protein
MKEPKTYDYPVGTSSAWRREGNEPCTSYRFTVLYIGGCDPLSYPPVSHGSLKGVL